MQNIYSQHKEKVLTTLHHFAPIQVQLAQRSWKPRPQRILHPVGEVCAALRRRYRYRVKPLLLRWIDDYLSGCEEHGA